MQQVSKSSGSLERKKNQNLDGAFAGCGKNGLFLLKKRRAQGVDECMINVHYYYYMSQEN